MNNVSALLKLIELALAASVHREPLAQTHGANKNSPGKTIASRGIAVRETSISWHDGGQIESPLKSKHYCIEGFKGSP